MSQVGNSPPALLDAPEGVSIELYAEIGAHLAVRTDARAYLVLDAFGVDEDRWSAARKIWAQRIEEEAVRASEPGQKGSAAERYPLTTRYAAVYAAAAEKAREEKEGQTPEL